MRLVFPILLVTLAACGGSTTTELFSDASTNDSGGSNDSGGGHDSGGNDAGGGQDARPDVGPNCQSLLAAIASAQEKATKCNPGDANQCMNVVQGMCCPIVVNDPTTTEVKDFVAAVDAAKKAGCQTPCPPCAAPQKLCNKNNNRCM